MAQTKNTTERSFTQLGPWHGLVLLSVLTLAFLGGVPDSQSGWLTCPPCPPTILTVHRVRPRRRSHVSGQDRLEGLVRYVTRTWPQPVVRTLLLTTLWSLSGRHGPVALLGWPWLLWMWQVLAAACPDLCCQPLWCRGRWLLWQGQRLILVGYLGWALYEMRQEAVSHRTSSELVLGLGCQVCGCEGPWVETVRQEDGGYQAVLCGHFVIRVAGDDPFRARLLMLFLRLLDAPGYSGTRPTRDGRRPFVRQQQLAKWFHLPQPDISRVEGYWVRGAWPELLSRCTPEFLTPELVQRASTVCATFPQWSQERVYRYLHSQGVQLSQRQVRQELGIKVAKSTIQRYISEIRGPLSTKQTWSTFLRNHAKDIWAVDFLQTYGLFFRAIFVFVVIELGSRRLLHFGVTRSPSDAWVAQQLREATPFGQGPRFLIRDNDNKFGDAFDRVADGTDIEVLTTPFQAPRANAICERFLGSLRRECLDFFLILNERHLHRILKQYQHYFNEARPHQGISQRIPCRSDAAPLRQATGTIIAHPILGGLHHDYHRQAAGEPSLPRAA